MINERIQKYVNDHSFCSEYLFKDWEAFLDFIYEEGVAFRPSFGGSTVKRTLSMDTVVIPIRMTGNGCILRPGFMKMDLKKNLSQI